MTVGFYDVDLMRYAPIPFNLEIMKLSSYYKNRREIVGLAPYYFPEKYSKFIVRKDFEDGTFPDISADNIEYGGLAFTNNIYIPLNEEIELCEPDTYLYADIFKNLGIRRSDSIAFNGQYTANHIRLSLDGQTIWKNWEKMLHPKKRTTTLMLHDYNLQNVDGAAKLLEDYQKEFPRTSIGMKFPVEIDNEKDLFLWRKMNGGDFFSLRYNGILSDEAVVELGIAYSNYRGKLEYNITYGCSDEDDFVKNRLQKIYRQIVFLQTKGVTILLKYRYSFFKNRKLCRLVKLMSLYASSKNLNLGYMETVAKESLYNFYLSMRDSGFSGAYLVITKQEATELLKFAEENYPYLYYDFKNCLKPYLQGGKLTYGKAKN